MDIENVRFLLSALIQSLATVMVIGFIALLSFPRSTSGSVKNTKMFEISLEFVKKIGIFFIIAIFIIIFLLAFLDSFDMFLSVMIAIIMSFFSFYLLIIFLSDYISQIKKL